MIIVGDKEAETKTVSLRLRDGSEHKGLTVDQLMTLVRDDIKTRKLQSSLAKAATINENQL